MPPSFPLPFLCTEASSLLVAYLVKTSHLQSVTPYGLRVVEVVPGFAPLGIACIDYRNTTLGPYGEVGLSWPVVKDGGLFSRLPALPLLAGARWPNQGWWVHALPVTTTQARDAGVTVWGYPKFLADIRFEWKGSRRTCSLSEGGRDVLQVTVDTRMEARPQRFLQRTYTKLNAELRLTDVTFEGTGSGKIVTASAQLELGTHTLGQQLALWGVADARPVNVQWFPVWRSVLPAPGPVVEV